MVAFVSSRLVRRAGGHRRLGASALVLGVAAGLLVSLPALPVQAAGAGTGARATSADKSVAVSAVRPAAVAGSAMPDWQGGAAVWPTPGWVDVDLAASAPVPIPGVRRGRATVGGLPVTVSSVASSSASPPSRVRVEVADRALVRGGGTALALRLSRADGVRGAVPVHVEVSYDAFRFAYGGDWASRLRLVKLPACVLTTPGVDDCWAPEALASTNDSAAGVVGADVVLDEASLADIPVPAIAGAAAVAPSADGSVMVALASGPSSETGDFSQTSLSQSASWQAGGSAGGFSWSYPISVPPVPSGLAPTVSLDYSSAAVDGQTANNNTQPGWLGEGWSYEPGYIERVFRPCAQDTAPVTPVWTDNTDVCWRMQNAKLMWNGKATELVASDASANPNTALPTVWHLADDDATKVEYLSDSGTSITGLWNNERWKLTTKDGTQYFFGMSVLPGSTTVTNSVLGEPVVSNSAGEPCFSAVSLASSYCSMAYRWNLDYVVDPHGNSMVYYYTKETNLAHKPGGNTPTVSYDRAGLPVRAEYGLRAGAESTTTTPARVVFNTGNRCFTASCSTHDATNWPDTPWDLACAGGPCPAPSFWSTRRLASISVQVWTGSGSTYRNVDFYLLSGQFPAVPSGQTSVLWLSRIGRSGQDTGTGVSGATVTLPDVVFYGVQKENRALADPGSGAPFATKWRLNRIDSESGAQTSVAYSDPDSGCVFPATAPNPDSNYRRCFPQEYQGGWTWWHKYVATSVTEHDAVGGSPDVMHAYTYVTTATVGTQTVGTGSVLWHHDMNAYGSEMAHRSWSQWAGYPVVTTVTGPASGTRSKSMSLYYTGLHQDRTDAGDGTRSVSLTDTEGVVDTDDAYKSGTVRETITFNGDTSTVLSKTINNVTSTITGQRTLSSTWALSATTVARLTNTAQTTTRTWLAGSSTWRVTQTSWTYDTTYGQVLTESALGDTGTGSDDVCTTTTYNRNTTENLRRFDGTGPSAVTFAPVVVSADWSMYDPSFPTGDFNANGTKDVIARRPSDGSLWLFDGTSSGGFSAPTSLAASGWNAYFKIFSPGDMTGDGKPDVLASKTDGTLWRFTNTGGALAAGVQIAPSGWQAYDLFSPGDWTGDGKGDVLGRNISNGSLWMWTGTGAGTVNAGVQIGTSGWDAYMQVFGWGDITGDGKSDLLAADNAGLWVYAGNAVAAGTYAARVRMATGLIGLDSDWFVASGDVTGDGKADIFARQYRYLPGPVSTVHTVGVACGTTPTYPGDAVSDTRYFYDQPGVVSPVLATLPSLGDVTRTERAKLYTGSTPTWISGGETVRDHYGRPTSVKDPLGHQTTMAYTETFGLTTTMATTNALSHVTTRTLAVGRGLPVTVTDPNTKVTTGSYDALGRLLKVWKPGHPTSGTPDAEYAYVLNGITSAPYVSVKALSPAGTQITSYQILDGLLRARQTQTPVAAGGRAISDIQYDGRGLSVKSSSVFNASAPAAILAAFADTSVESQHRYTYDGTGRQLTDELWSLNIKKWNVTTTSYDGDRTTVDNAAGGTDTTTVVDALGRTTQLWQYQAATPTGAHDTTSYGYDHAGNLTSLQGPDGATWSYSYDLLGRKTQTVDPDAGTSSTVFNDDSTVDNTTDARGQVLRNTYDVLGRRTGVYDTTVSAANQLAGWVYDTVAAGQLSSATRYVGGAAGSAYTRQTTAFDDGYRPTHTNLVIPAAEGALAGTYGTDYTYKTNGAPDTVATTTRAGAAVGGLPAETLAYSYNSVGQPTGLAGAQTYIASAAFTFDGQLAQQILGVAGKQVRQTLTLDAATRRLLTSQVDTENQTTPGTFVDRATDEYGFDDAGNVQSMATKNSGVRDQAECFDYDYLRRLTDAWTEATLVCNSAAKQKTGVDPYRLSWTLSTGGNRTNETSYNADGSTASSSTYTYGGAGHGPHVLASVVTTGSGAGTKTYDADPAGNTTSRPGPGGQQTLTWDPEGHLATVVDTATTSNLYDADGARLIRHDPAGYTTLTLPDATELRANAAGAVAGTRYYGTTAVRKANTDANGNLTGGDALTWTISDHHGTGSIAINPVTLQTDRRRSLPYGGARGAQPDLFGTKGFVGGTIDPTGLTHLGAREYDPTIGRFISDDPVTDTNNPQQANGYAYANNQPTTASDPDGLKPCYPGDDCAKSTYKNQKAKQPWYTKPSTCSGGKGKTYPLNSVEQEQKRQADAMLKKYGADRQICALGKCWTAGEDVGPHELAWCHMVGFVECVAAFKAKEASSRLADQWREDHPSEGKPADDPEWNARHHGLWMAIMVADGVSAEDAMMLGVAHELDAGSRANRPAPAFGSVDSRIDMRNNAMGIEIGLGVRDQGGSIMAAWASNGGYTGGGGMSIDRAISNVDSHVEATKQGTCGTLCFDMSQR